MAENAFLGMEYFGNGMSGFLSFERAVWTSCGKMMLLKRSNFIRQCVKGQDRTEQTEETRASLRQQY